MPGINMNNAAPGLGRLALAMGGGPAGAYQKAYNNELGLQSRLAQAMAAIEASGATADLNRAKTDSERAEQAMRTPEALRRTAMLNNGIPLDEAASVDSFLKTGHLSGKYDLDPTQQGPTMPTPDWVSKLGDVARAMSGTERALTIGDKSSENIAKAAAIERGERLSDSVINGTANRNTVAGAQAAAAGKDLFSTDATGSVLDRFTGNLATDNPMAGSTINLRKEQAGAQRANAGQSVAAAEASRASAEAAKALAEQRRQVTAAGPGAGKAPSGYRWEQGPSGEARLAPIPGGPKDPSAVGGGKPLPTSAAKGYLDNLQNLRRAETALALVEGKDVGNMRGDQNATGMKGFLPNTVLNYADPEGVDTRAAIADLGSLVIHDRSGAAVTAAEFPRLAPFIPRASDDAATVKKKLKLFTQNYRALVDDSAEFYRASGYRIPELGGKSRDAADKPPVAPSGGDPVQINSEAEYEALPSGAEFIAPDGSHRRKP